MKGRSAPVVKSKGPKRKWGGIFCVGEIEFEQEIWKFQSSVVLFLR